MEYLLLLHLYARTSSHRYVRRLDEVGERGTGQELGAELVLQSSVLGPANYLHIHAASIRITTKFGSALKLTRSRRDQIAQPPLRLRRGRPVLGKSVKDHEGEEPLRLRWKTLSKTMVVEGFFRGTT